MKKRNSLFAFGLLALFCSCQNATHEGDYLITKAEPADKEILLSEITTGVRIVPLETNAQSLIKNIEKIVLKDGKYYINDAKARLMVFDVDGKYIRSISGIGGGPGEYASIQDFDVDARRNTIAVVDLGKIHFYTLDGAYQYTIRIDGGARNIFLLPDGKIALRTDAGEKVFRILDTKGNILNEYIDKHPHLRHRVAKNIEFHLIKNRIFAQDGVSANDLWCYDNGKVTAWKIIDDPRAISGEKEDEFIENEGLRYQQHNSGILRLSRIVAAKNFSMVFASAGKDGLCFLLDNDSGLAKSYTVLPKNQLFDDLSFLNKESPLFLFFLSSNTQSENNFVAAVEPYRIADGLEHNKDLAQTENYQRIKTVLDSLEDIDNANPILIEYDFKRIN